MSNIPSRVAAFALLLFMFLVAGGAALHESPVVDEIAHIGAGLSYVKRLDLRLNEEHPPLTKIIAGVPLALRGTSADFSGPLWTESETALKGYLLQWPFGDSVIGRWNNWRITLAWARFPMLLLTLWLGWLIYRYGERLTDSLGALLCLSMYCIMPAFLVFGPLVITDIPVTLFTVMTLWRVAELWTAPTPRNIVLFAAAFAAALLSKFTGLILFPVILTFLIGTRIWKSDREPVDRLERKAWRRTRFRACLKGTAWALVTVYVVYLVFSWNQPDSALDKIGPETAIWAHVFRRLLMPPWLYVRGILLMLLLGSRPTFLLGHVYPHGIPIYFPVVFALKSPLGFLLLLCLAAVLWAVLRKRRSVSLINPRYRTHWRVLMTGLIVYVIVCLLSRLDISIRHFTVPLALMILLLAPLPRMVDSFPAKRLLRAAVAVLALSCFIGVLPHYPHFFPFINSLGGGVPAYKLVNDSNVDWNESLPDLERVANQRGWHAVKLDYLALANPAIIAPDVVPWNCEQPAADDAGKWVIVAAPMILEERNCGWIENQTHIPIAAGAMYAFHLPDPLPEPGGPGGPPDAAHRTKFFGASFDLRGLSVELEDHPERTVSVMNALLEQFRQQQRAQSKH